MIEYCKQCGIKLFEQDGNNNRKIFRSFSTRKNSDGTEYHLCIDCHEGKNKEMFEKNLSEN